MSIRLRQCPTVLFSIHVVERDGRAGFITLTLTTKATETRSAHPVGLRCVWVRACACFLGHRSTSRSRSMTQEYVALRDTIKEATFIRYVWRCILTGSRSTCMDFLWILDSFSMQEVLHMDFGGEDYSFYLRNGEFRRWCRFNLLISEKNALQLAADFENWMYSQQRSIAMIWVF